MPALRVEEMIRKVHADVDALKVESAAKKMKFTMPSDDQLRRALTITTPKAMIVGQGWSGSAPAGGTITYGVTITNPTSLTYTWLFIYQFIGPANMVPDVGAALATADIRFPRFAYPSFAGFSLAPGATTQLNTHIHVPTGVDGGTYLGNTFLFAPDWHDVGNYLDRSVFPFDVTPA